MLMGVIEQTDEETRTYDVEGNIWLSEGETFIAAVPTIEESTVDPSTITVGALVTDDRFKLMVSGGAAGESALLKVLASTSLAQTIELTWRVRVKEH